MNRDDERNERLVAEILAMPIDAVRRELEEAGLYPADAAETYPKAFAYFAARAAVKKAANDDGGPIVVLAAFDGSSEGAAAIGDAPDAGLIGWIAGVQGRAALAMHDGAVELRLETPASISRLRLRDDSFDLHAVDGSDLIYVVNELGEEEAYRFWFDHDQASNLYPVSWS